MITSQKAGMFAQWLKERRKLIPDPKAPALFSSATGCAGSQAQSAASTSLWYRSLIPLRANRIHGSHTGFMEVTHPRDSAGPPPLLGPPAPTPGAAASRKSWRKRQQAPAAVYKRSTKIGGWFWHSPRFSYCSERNLPPPLNI